MAHNLTTTYISVFFIIFIQDEIQLVVSGTAIPLVDPNKSEPASSCMDSSSISRNTPSPLMSEGTPPSTGGTPPMLHDHGMGDADDDIFTLDEEQLVKNNQQLESFEEKNVLYPQVGAIGFTRHINLAQNFDIIVTLGWLFANKESLFLLFDVYLLFFIDHDWYKGLQVKLKRNDDSYYNYDCFSTPGFSTLPSSWQILL